MIYCQYYLEIKNRLLLSFLNWITVLIICYFYKEPILFFCVKTNWHSHFIFTNVTEIFYVHLKLLIFIANQVLIVILIYHVILFLASSLYKIELVYFKILLKLFFVSWLMSSLVFYKLILPLSWNFFLNFQTNLALTQPIEYILEAKIEEYIEFFINLYYSCLITHQLLFFVAALLVNSIEKLEKIKTFRKLFYLIFILFSTLITPPEIISQVIISFSLILIYEFILFIKIFKFKKVTN